MIAPPASIVPSYSNIYVLDQSLVLISRDEFGHRITREIPAEYVAFFRRIDLDEKMMRSLRSSIYVRSVDESPGWVRVGFTNDIARQDFCVGRKSFVAQLGIESFEADVSPVMRYLVDNDIKIARPERVYIDLETDSRVPFARKEEMRILCWALVDEHGRTTSGVLPEDTDRAERKLLDDLWEALEPYDQVLAWNGDGFDFPVLYARSYARGCAVDAERWLWTDHLALFKRMNLNASESGDEKRSMALNAIAQAELGFGKEESPPEVVARFGNKPLGALAYALWAAGGDMLEILVLYNLKDTDLLRLIEQETGYIALFDSLCEACGIFGDSRGLNPTRQMDGFMLRLGRARDRHFPTKAYRETVEKYKGAYVMEPRTNGIERNVHVADFAGMYPSIILTWNMSNETKSASGVREGQRKDNEAFSPLTGITFRTDIEGLLPIALGEMIRLRKAWNDEKSKHAPGTPEWQDANRKSAAYKVAANSFYGVLGSPFARFFDREIAESVTQCGAWLIHRTIEEAERRGMRAVYADTDSVFVVGVTEEVFRDFVAYCNATLYPKLLADVGCVKNAIKLEYEKAFDRLVMLSAKKYVASFVHYKGKRADSKSKPEIKGVEYKRGDAIVLAAQFQARVIDMLCGGLGKNPDKPVPTDQIVCFEDAIYTMRAHVLDKPLPLEEIRLAKALNKPLRDYVQKKKLDGSGDAANSPHIMLARKMAARGEDVTEGTRIEYVIADGSSSPIKVIPAADYTGTEVDRFYLWEKLVYPPTQRLLEAAFPLTDWERFLKVRPAKVKAPRVPRAKKVATPAPIIESPPVMGQLEK